MILNQKLFILIIFAAVSFLSFLKKGQHDLQEWDESRNGVNAFEMLGNKDFVNLYFDGKVDTWNAKPPLMIWMIAGSYKLFGFNEFALRFPSTICTIIFFILCFYTIKLLEGELIAFLTCLILITCKAIFGNHIGLTGDFDCPLLLFLTASVYSFILYVEKQKKYGIILVGVFTGLAFYTKGPASLTLIPGFLLYIFLRRKTIVFRDLRLWISAAVFIIIAGSWILISYKYGVTTQQSYYGSKNNVETMLIYDTFQRLTNSKFDNAEQGERDYQFFFEVINARFNLWDFLFDLTVLAGIYFLFKARRNFVNFINEPQRRMLLLSFCLIIPLSIVLTFAASKHNWYMTPLFMFIALITVKGILFFGKKWKPVYLICSCLFIFTLTRQVYYICTLPTEIHKALMNNRALRNHTVYASTGTRQDILLYFKWLNVNLIHKDNITEIPNTPGTLIFVDDKQYNDNFLGKATSVANLEGCWLISIPGH